MYDLISFLKLFTFYPSELIRVFSELVPRFYDQQLEIVLLKMRVIQYE